MTASRIPFIRHHTIFPCIAYICFDVHWVCLPILRFTFLNASFPILLHVPIFSVATPIDTTCVLSKIAEKDYDLLGEYFYDGPTW